MICRLAKEGKHDEVKNYLSTLNDAPIIGGNFGDLTAFYIKEFGEEEGEAILAILREKGLLQARKANLSDVIELHLESGDLEKAVVFFEQFAKNDKKLPYKFRLMSRLIEVSLA